MGITHIEKTLEGHTGEKANTRFLVDSGATYSSLPKIVELA